MTHLVGSVTKWFPKRNFGKVSNDSEGTFDMHRSAWKDAVEPTLGMAVEFSLEHDFSKSKLVCADVRCLNSTTTSQGFSPAERSLSECTATGTVKIWSRRGYGFITSDSDIQRPCHCPAGSDIFVARADLLESGNLTVGKRVAFRVYKCDGGKTQMGAAEVEELKDLSDNDSVTESRLRPVPFWEWPLTRDEKKIRVMALFQRESSDLQDEFEECQDEAACQLDEVTAELEHTQRKLKQAEDRIAELEAQALRPCS